jgi:hypothetical protein
MEPMAWPWVSPTTIFLKKLLFKILNRNILSILVSLFRI